MDNKKLNFYKLAIKENKAKTLELLEGEFVRENVTMSELENNFDGFKDKVLEDETVVQSNLKVKFENAKTNEKIYHIKVKTLIREGYSIEQEIGLTNDCNMALMAGEPIPQTYIDYRNYIESCKDTAHLEVFEVERP